MPLTNAGRDFIAKAIINDTPDFFIGGDTFIGVGNATDNVSPETYTDLQGASKERKLMDGGFPTIAGNALTFQATFPTAEGIFTWAEWGVFNDAAAGTMLSRKVEALGTKTTAQTWQITVVLTIDIGV